MSIAEKITGMMMRPGEDAVPRDEVPMWMKYAGRAVGTIGSVLAIGLGIWNCFALIFADVSCFISGVWQMLAGFIVIIIEAPCCCLFLDFVQNISDWVDKRPYWNRALFYVGIALPAIFMCPGVSSIFGCGMIFATGVIYGMMALGKKASREEMRTNAAMAGLPTEVVASGTHSNLVDQAAPMGFTKPPAAGRVI